jgi:hypothetical protein
MSAQKNGDDPSSYPGFPKAVFTMHGATYIEGTCNNPGELRRFLIMHQGCIVHGCSIDEPKREYDVLGLF